MAHTRIKILNQDGKYAILMGLGRVYIQSHLLGLLILCISALLPLRDTWYRGAVSAWILNPVQHRLCTKSLKKSYR